MSANILSDDDMDTLHRAADLRKRFDAGIFPRGAGQHAHFRKLERMGLIVFDAWGRDIDGMVEDDVMIYKLTAKGLASVQGHAP